MGPSGSGKVLLKHIIGLEKPDAGEPDQGNPSRTPKS
jgi:ABC-type transporter Mla maintaining outer membrane lipid asymmetry ATPase subunit MlaF